ncbi:hypothetical protein L0U85_08530 [Glycomyces sp. L485]|uniref:hypothetical protein n=1 Tax=Glycomyces sp. L485 TaxID=2909235 RepID=UPI001F4ACEF3|nr:hypothetical protein [Glycomyces sp. L485]MCH7230893.1 hypothetical protein [Glycomyces sp. L485]
MRVCLKVQIPVEAGNKAIMNGDMSKTLKATLDKLNPEATYFFPQDGMRSMMVFFDLKDPSQMPVISEPLFEELHAETYLTPVMNIDDLMKGLKTLQENR